MKIVNNFEALVRSQLPYLEKVALHYTHDEQSAKDLLQDTVLRIWSNREKFQVGTNFKAWSSVIMRNIFINSHRKKHLRQSYASRIERDEAENCFENSGEQMMMYNDLLRTLHTLKPIYSRPLELYYEGYSYQEIAEDQGVALGTVKSRMYIARTYLKERLALVG